MPDQRYSTSEKKHLNRLLAEVRDSEQFQKFLDLAAEVTSVNPLRLGMNREQLITFFVNMHNIIVLHSFVSKGAKSLSNILSRRSFLSSGSYELGGFTISLEEIRNSILLKKKPLRGPNIRLNSICICEPRVLFALSLCTYSSPPIRVMHPHSLEDALNSATEEELISSVQLDVANKTITVPKMMNSRVFGKKDETVSWVADHLPHTSTLRKQIRKTQPDLRLRFREPSYDFYFNFITL